MNFIKRILPEVVVVAFFALISFVYFYPANIEGRVLGGHDNVAGIGAGREAQEYFNRTGERTRWSNAIFGGMPTYQTSPYYESSSTLFKLERAYRLFISDTTYYVFILLLGFYILLRAFSFRIWMAALGAVLWAFSSYFFIIIGAGHIWKVLTLAYIPVTIAGMVLVYRGKRLWGAIVMALFLAFQIHSNHVQMSYYFLLPMFLIALVYAIDAYREKRLVRFFKDTGILVIAAILGICINLSNLYHTYEYSKETMRGKSELVKPDTGNQTSSGLERDYITAWSYGIGETWTLLVPNTKGGASVPLSRNKIAMEKANPAYRSIYNQVGQYWGEQPGTSGPVYVGAFVVLLFVLGLFIVKGPMKWALLFATILSILLSWGKNFMGFTDLFLDYVPMYDKFRAVASILVIAEFTIPLLAMFALKELVTRVEAGELNKSLYGIGGKLTLTKSLYISAGIVGGIVLLFALFPGTFFPQYLSSQELTMFKNAIPAEHLGAFMANLSEMRQAMFVSDAWRSFVIIVIGVLIVLLFFWRKINQICMVMMLLALCLFDMWQVNLRYLDAGDHSMFVPKRNITAMIKKTPTDEKILQDKSLDYRVLNLSSNTFNENTTAYFHKSVGGYHAAKLRRYQEMIEEHIAPEMRVILDEVIRTQGRLDSVAVNAFPVVNMLNTRWFIVPGKDGTTVPVFNPLALGNAWFVYDVKYVDNANEEIEALHKVNPAIIAVVDNQYQEQVRRVDSEGNIMLKEYEPNRLVYETESSTGGVVVFSEIYYPGWRSYIDGEEVEHGRANYILRAMNVPAGKHKIEFVFDPQSLHVTETIAYIALSLLLLGTICGILILVRNGRRNRRV